MHATAATDYSPAEIARRVVDANARLAVQRRRYADAQAADECWAAANALIAIERLESLIRRMGGEIAR